MSDGGAVHVEFGGATSSPSHVDVDLLFVALFHGEESAPETAEVNAAVGGELARAVASGEFRAKPFELHVTPLTGPGWKARRIGFVGAGRRADASPERLRRVAAACSYTARCRSAQSTGLVLPGGIDLAVGAQAFADGLSAAEFDGASYKTKHPDGHYPARLVVVAPVPIRMALAEAVHRGRMIGRAQTSRASWRTNPANVLTPREFADRVAAAVARRRPDRGRARRGSDSRAEDGLAARRRAGQRGAAAPHRDPPRAARRARDARARPRRQGHHVRHRRHLDQAGRRHGADEGRHGRRRGGGRARCARSRC